MTNSLTSQNDAEFKNNESNTLLVFDGTYTAKKQDVNLQDWSIVGSGLAALNSKTTVKFFVTVDDEEDEDEYKEGKAEGSLSEEVFVKVGESVKVKVEAEVEAEAAEGWYSVTGIKLDAEPTAPGTYIFNGKKVFFQAK